MRKWNAPCCQEIAWSYVNESDDEFLAISVCITIPFKMMDFGGFAWNWFLILFLRKKANICIRKQPVIIFFKSNFLPYFWSFMEFAFCHGLCFLGFVVCNNNLYQLHILTGLMCPACSNRQREKCCDETGKQCYLKNKPKSFLCRQGCFLYVYFEQKSRSS